MPRTALILPLFAALAFALLAGPRPAAAQAPGWQPAPVYIATKKSNPTARAQQRDGRIIACRPEGCFRIPYGCYTEAEYDFWGNPTGYDKIVCPRR